MALGEIKIDLKEQETKDESQASGSYKIRQVIIKTMKHTHTHSHIIHIHEQSENSPTKIKYGSLIWRTKEIKKLYLSVNNKTNLSTNWKTKLKQGAKWGIKH